MHDALSDRTGIVYEEYTPEMQDQVRQLTYRSVGRSVGLSAGRPVGSGRVGPGRPVGSGRVGSAGLCALTLTRMHTPTHTHTVAQAAREVSGGGAGRRRRRPGLPLGTRQTRAHTHKQPHIQNNTDSRRYTSAQARKHECAHARACVRACNLVFNLTDSCDPPPNHAVRVSDYVCVSVTCVILCVCVCYHRA